MYNNAPYGAFANELKSWDTKATTHFTWLQRAPLGMIETRYFRYAHLNAALARQLQKLLFKPLFVCVCVFSVPRRALKAVGTAPDFSPIVSNNRPIGL